MSMSTVDKAIIDQDVAYRQRVGSLKLGDVVMLRVGKGESLSLTSGKYVIGTITHATTDQLTVGASIPPSHREFRPEATWVVNRSDIIGVYSPGDWYEGIGGCNREFQLKGQLNMSSPPQYGVVTKRLLHLAAATVAGQYPYVEVVCELPKLKTDCKVAGICD